MSFQYITKDFIFDKNITDEIKKDINSSNIFPSVYIIYCKKKKKAYIGETTNIIQRLSAHIKNPEKKQLKNVKIIFSNYFNKSSVIDIESNLIQNIQADNKFQLLNGNDGISNHQYYQKNEYHNTFKDIWKNLQFEKLVKNDLLDIQNSDLFKYSPYKSLSEDQWNSIREYLFILNNSKYKTSTFIQGSAGTGKTILAVYLIKLLLSNFDKENLEDYIEDTSLIELAHEFRTKIKKETNTLKIALVIPMTSLRKTLQNVFKSIYGLSKDMVIGPNEVKNDYYDLLIVDEAHRLKRRKNITGYAQFDKTNKHFRLGNEGNELDWIRLSSDNQLFFYDENQSVRPADIEKYKFDEVKKISKTLSLKSQMRVKGGKDYINFIDNLLLNSNNLEPWQPKNYELKLFTSMPKMIKKLEEKEKEYGLCRTISGYSWKWISSKNDIPDITIDGIDLYWNKTNKDWINSTNKMTEMGCIHTTQGYDLNYAGIIFGSDITYNKKSEKIEINKENYFDRNGKIGISNSQLHDYIINIYKTIMYRGIKGTYVYCYNKELREYFKKYIPTVDD